MTLRGVMAQGFRFGLVGGIATGTHVAVFIALIEGLQVRPLMANFVAWIVAFSASFLGHYYWTFRDAHSGHGRSARGTVPRFFLVSLLGLGLNTVIVIVIVDMAHLPYGAAAVLMATLVPGMLFIVSKIWAFA